MPAERRAVLLLLGLAVAGQALRAWVGRPDVPPGEVRLLSVGAAGSPRAHRDSSLAAVRPLGPGERIDLDRATAVEIARLPRVGLALARAIVVDREAHGPFGSLPALDRVPGIGPGLVTAIETHVTFSGNLSASPAPPAPSALDLNTAGAADLERLPFIGTYMARQIVAYRDKHGAFPSVDSLVRVPGIGPATLAKVRDRLRVEQ